MTYLLDTHVWLWMLTEPGRMADEVREIVSAAATPLLLSAASSWEIAIKYGLGRLPLPEPPATYVPSRLRSSGVRPVGVEHSHCLEVANLPRLHRDPFDRLLVAHARLERLTIITADEAIRQYDVPTVAA